MITAYSRKDGKIVATGIAKGQELPKDAVWIDLLNPENNERNFISSALGLELPTITDMQEIETSSRLYAEGNATFMTIDVVVGSETPDPVIDALLVVLTPSCFVTLRYSEPHAVTTFISRLKQQPDLLPNVEDGLLAFLDAITDRIADILEMIGKNTEQLSQQIFRDSHSRKKEQRLQDLLRGTGRAGDMTHKIRDSINSMTRLMGFLSPRLKTHLGPEQVTKFQALERDVASLAEHAQFVTQEITFLLDATLGQINVEQNNILKIMSVVMVAFTPPTFFASMWGMNFHNMPEYAWDFGYPMAWVIMLISAIIPLIYFKKRGWF